MYTFVTTLLILHRPPVLPRTKSRSGFAMRHRLRGAGLLEALVALAVLSVGMAALIQLHLQQHADGRDASHRGTAIHLIGDMHNRMLFNRQAAQNQAYALAWNTPVSTAGCGSAICNASERSMADLHEWRSAVKNTLPGGQSQIIYSLDHPRQVGIAVAWDEQGSQAHVAANADSTAPPNTDCPAAKLCQLTYVEL